MTQIFDKRAVARRGRFGDHDTVARLFLGARPAQSDLQQVSSISSVRGSIPREWAEYKSAGEQNTRSTLAHGEGL